MLRESEGKRGRCKGEEGGITSEGDSLRARGRSPIDNASFSNVAISKKKKKRRERRRE